MLKPIRNKAGKGSPMTVLIVAFVAVVALALLLVTGAIPNNFAGNTAGQNEVQALKLNPSTGLDACKDSPTTAVTIVAYNALNTSSQQSAVMSYNLFKVVGDNEEYQTQGTTGVATTVDCGNTYVARMLSNTTNLASGNVVALLSAGKDVLANGNTITFRPASATQRIEFTTVQLSALKFQLLGKTNGVFYAENNTGASDATYYTTGVKFTSTIGNTTDTAVGSGESLTVKYSLKSTATDFNANPNGMYMLIDAPTTIWDTPVVAVDGQTLANVKGSLDSSETRAYADYEFVFKIDSAILNTDKVVTLTMPALNGQNPTADVEVSFAQAGFQQKTVGKDVRLSPVSDASSPVALFTKQVTVLGLS